MNAFCAHRVRAATGASALQRPFPVLPSRTLGLANHFPSPLLKKYLIGIHTAEDGLGMRDGRALCTFSTIFSARTGNVGNKAEIGKAEGRNILKR
jgi:hypothetical protein